MSRSLGGLVLGVLTAVIAAAGSVAAGATSSPRNSPIGSLSSAASTKAAAAPTGTAPGGPGTQSYLDVARKDCLGTARNDTSKVWFTVAGGVLSDVFSPNLESTNLHTAQYIVTDGSTFADMQQRDMTYSLRSLDRSGMVCRVTSIDAGHGFKLVSDYITDPARSSVLARTVLQPLTRRDSVRGLQVYVRYDATINNTGGGGATNQGANDATVDPGTTALVSADTQQASGPFAARVVGALVANRPFGAESSGFVGTASDGLTQLDVHHRLVNQYRSALDGNAVQTALVNVRPGRPFTLALGFGPTAQAAIATAHTSASESFGRNLQSYVDGWRAYDRGLQAPPQGAGAGASSAQRRYWLSANVLKLAEDKTYLGAFVASPTDPWGQAVPATTTHPGWTYREVFARDAYETFTGLLADGDRTSARQMVSFLFDRAQQPDGSFPRDSLLNGAVAPDTFGLSEIDEVAYPLLMAWAGGFAGQTAMYRDHIRPAADYIVGHGPSTGAERWEEHPGYSPSTIAAEIAGLVAAAHLAQAAGDKARAQLYLATADDYQRNIKTWTVTTRGPYAPRYFIRLSPTGNPNAAETYDLGNGSFAKVDQRRVIDAGFLELSRLGELPARDVDIRRSLRVVDSVLESQTSSGPGWHRYGIQAHGATDGYGDCYQPDPTNCSPTGAPWFGPGKGSGHLWPLLDGERAEHALQSGAGGAASGLTGDLARMSWGIGLLPEQVWEDPNVPASAYGADPRTASIGFINGEAAGSANPLIWAQAQYVRLVRDLQTGTLLDQPGITRARYVDHGPPSAVPVTITAPSSSTSDSTTRVTGTTAAGAAVVVAAGQPGAASDDTSVSQTVADAHGNFRIAVPTPSGTTAITAAASTGPRATGWAQETVSHPG
jgi:glucan 1,4-alpha-glucosidase